MNIVVCCKIVPDEQKILALPGEELDLTKVPWKISQYDLNAIEAAKKLSAETSGTLTALSVGSSDALENSKVRKDILSRGPDELALVIDDSHRFADSLETAKAIAAALKASGSFDVVLCGTGSGDLYSQEVGIQVGALLEIPAVNNVTKISVMDSGLQVERTLENEIEVLEVPLPAVLSVSSDINVPSVPAMKEIMRAGKKPVHVRNVPLADVTASIEQLSQKAPEQQARRGKIVEGDNEEAVESLYQFLRKEIL